MIPRSKNLKQAARAALRAAVPAALLVALVYFLLRSVLPEIIGLLIPDVSADDLFYGQGAAVWISLFLSALLILYGIVLEFGFHSWGLRVAREQPVGISGLLDGFGMAGRVILMELQIFLRILGWSLLLSLGYGFLTMVMIFIADADNSGLLYLIGIAAGIIITITVFVIVLRYTMAPYLLWDHPELRPSAAVRGSVEILQGHLWQLIKLHLSFLPWYLAQVLLGLAVEYVAVSSILRQTDLSAITTPDALNALVAQLQQAQNAPVVLLLSLLITLLFALLFLPYLEVTVANFYRGLSREPVIPAPTFSGESF